MKISELKNAPEWLVLANTGNADVELSATGRVIWCGGEWRGGEWRGGEWRGGEWRGGVWRGGVSMPRCRWYYGFENPNLIKIGCEKRTIEEWDKWFAGTEVLTTPRGTEAFKMIQACYEATKAYAMFINK